MGTNELNELLINALNHNQAGIGGVGLLTIFVVAGIPTLPALAAWIKASASKSASDKNAQVLAEVHRAVNSERTAMIDELKNLKDYVAVLSKLLAVEQEKRSGEQKAIAIARSADSEKAAMLNEAHIIELIKQYKP